MNESNWQIEIDEVSAGVFKVTATHASGAKYEATGIDPESNMVQESYSGTTHVANPADASSYIRQAEPGSRYVEFDVPTSSLRSTGNGWASINGPNSVAGRLAAAKGLPVPQMPAARNIAWTMSKWR